MAWMSQKHKKELAPGIKEVLKKYGVKATLSVHHHSTLQINMKSGMIDFENSRIDVPNAIGYSSEWKGHEQVNTYHIRKFFEGVAADFLVELKEAANVGNHNNSDPMTDYFDIGWYVDLNVGKWNKPYVYDFAEAA